MPRLSKIPERLHDEIKKKVGENVPASVIADWLGKEHNITISRQGISLFIKQWKEDRSAAAKVAYANAAAEHANIDITVIGDVILKFKEKVDKALIAEDYNTDCVECDGCFPEHDGNSAGLGEGEAVVIEKQVGKGCVVVSCIHEFPSRKFLERFCRSGTQTLF